MENEQNIVKGQKEKKFEFKKIQPTINISLLAIGLISSFAHAERRGEFDVIDNLRPITQTEKNRPRPINQEKQPTLVIPQEEQIESASQEKVNYEKMYREETETLSLSKQCERYLFGWIKKTDNEKEKIYEKITTLSSGAHVYLSNPTIDSMNTHQNKNDPYLNEKYILGLLDSVSTSAMQKELDPSKFIVIHKKYKEPEQIIIFTTILPEKNFITTTVEYIPYDGIIHDPKIKESIDEWTTVQGFADNMKKSNYMIVSKDSNSTSPSVGFVSLLPHQNNQPYKTETEYY